MRALFLDTSYCIALANSADTHQKSAQAWLRWLKGSRPALHLHDGILLEIGNGFARRGATKLGIKVIDGLLEDATVVRHALSVEIVDRAREHQRKHTDKAWGLTDCVSFVLMQDLGIEAALTADRDFVQAGHRALLHEDPPAPSA